ncbi:MAG: hypothetical protein DRR16_07770 [Candidatus Parabeggiatoa sp. nov. 3]|mgnify:CR=1 FL=1|nr:MAG: hypothetical protein DRR00_16725 [Gammaproteobacteria bacterium]RKZ62564.1 MAG: hypothetical protein DRQ99_18545 [Gammaproteobacteria bacterium]RKZ87245.1 MAG: hypothetical protein DRR16_07770 [Gammaproteobacteria bacterium]
MISFQQHYKGRFINMLRWHQLDELWDKVKAQPNGWYIYFVGETLPTAPADAETLNQFIQEVNQLLHQEHNYSYCGIVYADDKETPSMIKIFDPNNLGAACGSSGTVIPPRWLLTRISPEAIMDDAPTPANRKRWWQKLFPTH